MNKTNTTETTLKNIRSMCAERDRKEQSILRSNRLEIDWKWIEEKKLKERGCSIQTVF